MILVTRSDVPPISKKLSVVLTSSRSKISANKFVKNASMSFSGATYSVIKTGSGKFLRSVLPLAVCGISSSSI